MRDQANRHEQLGLTEATFYDAIVQNAAAVVQMGGDTLKEMAELVTSILQSPTIDWTMEEPVRAAIRTDVWRLLVKDDYLPDVRNVRSSWCLSRRNSSLLQRRSRLRDNGTTVARRANELLHTRVESIRWRPEP